LPRWDGYIGKRKFLFRKFIGKRVDGLIEACAYKFANEMFWIISNIFKVENWKFIEMSVCPKCIIIAHLLSIFTTISIKNKFIDVWFLFFYVSRSKIFWQTTKAKKLELEFRFFFYWILCKTVLNFFCKTSDFFGSNLMETCSNFGIIFFFDGGILVYVNPL
jgi:hypothetical protein